MKRSLAAIVVAVSLATASLSAVGAATASAPNTAGAPTTLKLDGQATDALAASTKPTLSWAPKDAARAEAQTAYEIRVVDVPSDIGSGRTPVWDSGQVSSDESTGISYGGPALAAGHTYEWTVRTWNRQGQTSPWSAAERFDVGPLTPQDWSASWLQGTDGALVRRTFTLAQAPVRARLYLAAQGLVEPHLNGSKVDPTEVLDSSVTDYAKRVVYRSFDVTSQLLSGTNALAVMLGKGQYAADPTFIAQLELTFPDGTHSTVATDDQWRTATGPMTKDDFYYGENWDASKQIAGWDTATFNDAGWAGVPVFAPVGQPASLALGKPVTAADETACCGWSRAALVDGIDTSTDASEGYHSAVATTADATKWVQVDLGSSQSIARLTLFPARPTNDPAGDNPGAGFPVRYKVEVSDDPTFATATTVVDRTTADQPNPGLNPVSIPATATGRYVRVTDTKLACVGTSCTFRLAEFGVYSPNPTVKFGLTQLEPDLTPPTRIVRTLNPVTATNVGGVTVYDFGQNYVGQVTLKATAPAGTTATIHKGEILDSTGRVTASNIGFSDTDPTRQLDAYTFDGSGSQTWTPAFNYAGFRYAEVTGLPAGTKVTITAQVIHSDVATTGSFSTSNPLLNQIQAGIVQTQVNDLQGMPLDCPTREKHGWLGDAGDTDTEAMENVDMQSLYAKWLGDIRTSNYADGSVSSVAPNEGSTAWYTDPAWGTAYPQIVWDSYTQYGDPTVITQNYTQVKGWVDYLATISDSNHIVTNSPGSWGDDWLSTESTPHVFFQTLFYLLDSRLLASMAQVMGNSADAAKYTAIATAIATGFNATYFDAATDTYAPNTELADAMPLALGIVPAGHEQAVVTKLVQNIAAHGNHLTTGFVGTTYVYQALGAYGRNDVALAISERTDYPSFGYMMTNGPGTIWEKWNNSSASDGTSSKDHIGLAGSIDQWYYQQLAGIQAGTPGWQNFTLAPSVVGDLTQVTASQQTVRGTITSAWQRTDTTLTYHAMVPVGATATIKLPLLGGTGSTVREGHTGIWTAGHAVGTTAGLIVGAASANTLSLTAGSGDYTFTVTAPQPRTTALTVTASGTPAPIVAGQSTTANVLVEAQSTGVHAAKVSAATPAGWTVQATPSSIPVTPATTATLASLKVTAPVGTPGGSYPIAVTVTANDGSNAQTTVNVTVFGTWPKGTTVTASSEHASNVVDGATRTYVAGNAIDGNLGTFWNDDTQDTYPDSLSVTTPTAIPLTGVGLVSSTDGVPTAFTIQTWNGSAWVTQADISGNTAVAQWIAFPASVTTSEVRIVVAASQNSWSRVTELSP